MSPAKDFTVDALRDLECAQRNELAAALCHDPEEQARIRRTARDQREWATAYLVSHRERLTSAA